MRNTADTLDWLRNQHDNPTQSWYRLCLSVTRQARGVDGVFPRAYDAWVGAEDKHPLTPGADWHDVPRGAPIFYKGPLDDGVEYGHIVTYFGVTQAGPLVWSNDVVAQGKMNMVSPLWFLSHWGHTLLGWTGDLNGVDLHLEANGSESAGARKAAPAPTATISVASVVAAAKADPGRPQGHRSKDACDDVLPVEKALVKLGWLPANLADGAFGTSTVTAYKKWQQSLGYRGQDADGIPGQVSLSRLGARFGFKVTA